MSKKSQFYFSIFLTCLFSPFFGAFSQIPSASSPDDSLIHIGDLIDVDVLGSVEYDWRGTLTPEGFINGIDFIEEPVFALCQSEETVGRKIAEGLSKLLRDPKVVVKILDRSNRPPSIVYGAVKKPQRFRLKRPVHLNELIVLAGGFTDNVSGEIEILRPENSSCLTNREVAGNRGAEFLTAKQKDKAPFLYINIRELLSGKSEANPRILSGDIVTVLEAPPIYITGGVANPRRISSRAQMTVSRAIATAGGLTKEANGRQITIFRRDKKETKIIEVDLDKIKENQSEDVVLQAFDIVEVSQKGGKKRKSPPIIELNKTGENNSSELPLRIID